jgi:hypothetical protein
MPVSTGIGFLSKIVSKATGRLNESLGILKDKMLAARVIDISLNSNSTLWEQTGEWQGIGSIQFQLIDGPTNEDTISSSKLNLAKPLFPHLKNYPLVNEVVLIFKLPTNESIANMDGATAYYYITPMSLWNHPEQNAYPNPLKGDTSDSNKSDYEQIEAGNTRKVNDESSEISLNGASGGTFTENGNIHPIIAFAGDNIVEGRYGNSIRFGNTSKIEAEITNNWSEVGDPGSPITILRNGQDPEIEPPGWIPTVEDINKDLASIYLTSTQKIPIETSAYNTSAFSDPPEAPEEYIKNQVILNSGRLLFNTNEDSIIISSQKNISINADKEIGISGEDNVTILSSKINLGDLDAEQSLVLGDDFMTQFEILLQNLKSLATALQGSQIWPGGAPAPDPSIPPVASTVQTQIQKIQNVVQKGSLLSKVSKTI